MICLRIIANLSVLFLLCVSAYAVIWVVERSSDTSQTSWWRRNEITVVMSMISFIFPMLFEILGLMEYYHPRMQLRLQLARIMILNLLNLYSLIWALFGKINGMTERLTEIKNFQVVNTTETTPLMTTAAPSTRFTTKLPTSTVDSITESVFSRISEVLNLSPVPDYPTGSSTTDYPTEPTGSYDYDNPDYFEVDKPQDMFSTTMEPTGSSFSSFTEAVTESFNNFTSSMADNFTDMFYMDSINDTDFSGDNGDLFENSRFNLSNLIDPFIMNASNVTGAGLTNPAFNFTNVEPIFSALERANSIQVETSSVFYSDNINSTTKLEIRKLCWETMFGQELVKLTVMDLVSSKILFQFQVEFFLF